jgi:spermidine synthase
VETPDVAPDRAAATPPGGPAAPREEELEPPLAPVRGAGPLLLGSVFIIAICGLIYELVAGALSSYLLGNSVTQFSVVIGLFLSAMGLGSFVSRFVRRALLRAFLFVEILVGLVGGCSALLLFFAFAALEMYTPLLVGLCLFIGTLVGLEIPLLVRILRTQGTLRVALGNVLAVDYLGALFASLAFPLLLLPHLGLVRTSFLFGLLNVAVAGIGLQVFGGQLGRAARGLKVLAVAVGALLCVGLVTAGRTTSWLEDQLYDDAVIYAKTTPYQRIVLTRWRDDLRLFLDGNIQFSSVDEFRYHEALVHPAMSLMAQPQQVLLLGAGDGLAAREVLKHRSVRAVHLVDLDPEITRLFARLAPLVQLNRGALSDARVRVINEDAQKYLERTTARYDVVIIDLPDPNNEALGKLYTRSFYRLVVQHLTPQGVLVTQATSPFYATDAFWCIANTIAATQLSTQGGALSVLPYHAQVPSFGEWGFVLAALRPLAATQVRLPAGLALRYLTPEVLAGLFAFPKDIAWRATPTNRLDDLVLLRLYEEGYKRYNR